MYKSHSGLTGKGLTIHIKMKTYLISEIYFNEKSLQGIIMYSHAIARTCMHTCVMTYSLHSSLPYYL